MRAGRIYNLTQGVPLNRQLQAGELIFLVFGNDVTTIFEVLGFSFSVSGLSDLNEPNAMEIVRLSDTGTDGQVVTFRPLESGTVGFSSTARHIKSAGWTVAPTVTDTLGSHPFNLSHGWRWPENVGIGTIRNAPSSTVGIGFRLIDTMSSTAEIHLGAIVRDFGG